MVYLTRKVEFEASHYYWFPELSPEENLAQFGMTTHRHGHNYVLKVTVRGKVDARDGMVVNIKDIDQILREHIVNRYDHKLINEQHSAFETRLPTTENLTMVMWEEIDAHLSGCELHEVCVYESPMLYASYLGENVMVTLTRVYEFSASHRLHTPQLTQEENREAYGKCNNPHGHGHNYVLEVSVRGPVEHRLGMVADLAKVEQLVQERVITHLDYRHLNTDVPPFDQISPTSENMVYWVWHKLKPALPELCRLRLHETSKSYFDYYGETE